VLTIYATAQNEFKILYLI